SLSDVLLTALLTSNPGSLGNLFPHLNSAPPPQLLPPLPVAPPRSVPSSPLKRHTVTVEIFCDTYHIDGEDCTRLKEVGFRPRDSTGPNLDDDLKAVGFALF
ncbi:hypothetical protein R3P38DRAFT_2487883, partial [Favolaschia claudopus]